MTYFIIFIFLALLVYHFDYQDHKKGRVEFYLLALIVLVCLSGLRYRIGNDTVVYEGTYNELPDLPGLFTFDYSTTRFKPGYIFLNAIARSISNEFYAMQFVHAIFVNSILFYFFYKNCSHIFVCVLYYYLFQFSNFNFEILRESCAIAVFTLGYPFLCEKKWLKYYLCAIGATLFHTSGLVTLIVPVIYLPFLRKFFQINKYTLFLVLALYVVGSLLATKFFDYLRLLEMADIDNYANTYENSDYAEGRHLNIIGLVSFVLTTLFYPLLLGWLKKNHYLGKEKKDFPVLESLVVVFIYVATLRLNLTLLYRFMGYFSPFLIILFGDTFFNQLKLFGHKLRLSFGIWCIFFLPYTVFGFAQYFQATYITDVKKYSRYYPYETVIFKDKDPKREALYRSLDYAI